MIARVYADDDGETHLVTLELAQGDNADGRGLNREMKSIPTTTVTLSEMVERRPRWDFHPAPRRQIIVVIRGAIEIQTTVGDIRRFGAGDVIFADDVDGRGHTFEDVGEELLWTCQIGIADDWHWPAITPER